MNRLLNRAIAWSSGRPLRADETAHQDGVLAEAGDRFEALTLVHGDGAGVGWLVDAGQIEREAFDRAAAALANAADGGFEGEGLRSPTRCRATVP